MLSILEIIEEISQISCWHLIDQKEKKKKRNKKETNPNRNPTNEVIFSLCVGCFGVFVCLFFSEPIVGRA